MKKALFLFAIVSFNLLFSQQTYYNDVDLTLSGIALKNELATKITSTHTNNLSYSEAREALKIVDLNPGQSDNVLLLYGFSSSLCPNDSANDIDHRRRDKTDFDNGGNSPCMWNREHTYPKSLGTPDLGTAGPGADVHHLRASDKKRNNDRASKKFGSDSGNSGTVGANWYPGDEWKGDVARMMMYMYLRYGNQCLPKNVCVGSAPANDADMITLLLQWNVDDPVSPYEAVRNNYLELTSNTYGQGNRNPFIDNPFLATRIWGGNDAEDIWGFYLATNNLTLENSIVVYPNPVNDILTIKTSQNTIINEVIIYTISGKVIRKKINLTQEKIVFTQLENGFYFVKIKTNNGLLIKKVVVK